MALGYKQDRYKGMTGDESGEFVAFLFSRRRFLRWSTIINYGHLETFKNTFTVGMSELLLLGSNLPIACFES